MKKIIFAFFAILALTLSACGTQTQVLVQVPATSFDTSNVKFSFPDQLVETPANGILNICGVNYDPNTELHTVGIICNNGGSVDFSNSPLTMMTIGTLSVPFPQAIGGSLVSSSAQITVLSAAGEALLVLAATASFASTAYASYESAPCAPEEVIGSLMVANPNGKYRPCGKLASPEKLPGKDITHNTCHDDTPANQPAQNRWQAARNSWGNWGSTVQNWNERAANIGEWRCSQTTLDGEIIRFGMHVATKITASNTYGNFVSFDITGQQITSFDRATWGDLINTPKSLRADEYQGRVKVEPMNCYDLSSYGINIKPPMTTTVDANNQNACTAQ